MHLIEVFTEDGCESCERVIELVQTLTGVPDLIVRVYERVADKEMFNARGVVICPATCIDGKLAFYGEFTTDQLRGYFSDKEQLRNAVPVLIAQPVSKPKASWLQLIRNIIAGFVIVGILMLVGFQCSKQPSADMVELSGGVFTMGGTGARYTDETPIHDVALHPFQIDRYLVTNSQFDEFARATGHITDAEYKGFGWAFRKGATDWEKIAGADWRHPEGPNSDIKERMNLEIVGVSLDQDGWDSGDRIWRKPRSIIRL